MAVISDSRNLRKMTPLHCRHQEQVVSGVCGGYVLPPEGEFHLEGSGIQVVSPGEEKMVF